MRVDKYLWSVRCYKSRNIASRACKKGSVRVNGAAVKPAREVYPGDEIGLRKNQTNFTVKVLDYPPGRVGAKLVGLYAIDTTPAEELEKTDLLNYSKDYYRKKGVGRPTKKDRRDLEDFTET
ncbi:MAG: RNA-binding S4 domain-containing protein, partial [Marinirhabdus sp.]